MNQIDLIPTTLIPIVIDNALPCVDFNLGDVVGSTHLMRILADIGISTNKATPLFQPIFTLSLRIFYCFICSRKLFLVFFFDRKLNTTHSSLI